MSKIDLEVKIEGLKKAIAEHKDFAGTYESQLKEAEQDLKDIDKPVLTASQLDDVYEAIERGVNEFDFSDSDNYNKEFGIDYDGKVVIGTIEINDTSYIVESIMDKIEKNYKVIVKE